MSDTETQDDKKRTVRRRVTQAAFVTLLLWLLRQMNRLFLRFSQGKITLTVLHTKLHDALATGHAKAAYMGRVRAGDHTPFDDDDTLYGAHVADAEETWLEPFMEDIRTGRYGDSHNGILVEALAARAAFYVLKLRGTANEAFVTTLDGNALVWWRMDGDEIDHCPECPQFAANSPFYAADLPAYPGDGSTSCVTLCKCYLETQDGPSGFQVVTL